MQRSSFLLFFLALALPLRAQSPASDSCPCCGAEYRRFDFWVGEWTVYNQLQNNQPAGTNRIVFLQDSCVIQENWESAAGGYTGTSYNWYDQMTGQWHQSWIDNQGGSLLLHGKFENGSMVMHSGEMKDRQNKPYVNRISWTPHSDGSLRQHWEVSADEGKTWKTVFDGLYRKKVP